MEGGVTDVGRIVWIGALVGFDVDLGYSVCGLFLYLGMEPDEIALLE